MWVRCGTIKQNKGNESCSISHMESLVVCLCCRVNGVMADQEESLLQQLTEITRVMQEGQLVEGMAPERKAQNDWEGESSVYIHKENSAVQYLCLIPKFRSTAERSVPCK